MANTTKKGGVRRAKAVLRTTRRRKRRRGRRQPRRGIPNPEQVLDVATDVRLVCRQGGIKQVYLFGKQEASFFTTEIWWGRVLARAFYEAGSSLDDQYKIPLLNLPVECGLKLYQLRGMSPPPIDLENLGGFERTDKEGKVVFVPAPWAYLEAGKKGNVNHFPYAAGPKLKVGLVTLRDRPKRDDIHTILESPPCTPEKLRAAFNHSWFA